MPEAGTIDWMSTKGLTIRVAADGDAEAMGCLHVRAWQSAYRGIMPGEYLDGLKSGDRTTMWRSHSARTDLRPVLVAEIADRVVGFAGFGQEQADTPSSDCGELYAINLDPDHWGRGIGRALLRQVTTELSANGFAEAVLWVIVENQRARGLYESEGWVADGAVSEEAILGVTVTDVRYRKSLGG